MGGEAGVALAHLEQSRERFERLNEPRMAAAALTEKADCLTDLGRYDESAEAYLQAVDVAERANDARQAAVVKCQLATVRRYQGNYSQALDLYGRPAAHSSASANQRLLRSSGTISGWSMRAQTSLKRLNSRIRSH